MKTRNAPHDRTTRRTLPLACASALAAVLALPLPLAAHDRDRDVTPPPVPTEIEVPEGNEAFLVGHAVGTQDYVCLPSTSGFAWTLFTPEATLFADNGRQIITHFFSPNPLEPNTNPRVLTAGGTVRAAWQHSRDSSTFWGFVEAGHSYSQPDFVAPGAIAWLRLTRAGVQAGPTGGKALTDTTLRPAGEHVRRARALDGVRRSGRRRQAGLRALLGRLFLLQGPLKRRGPGSIRGRGARGNRTETPSGSPFSSARTAGCPA